MHNAYMANDSALTVRIPAALKRKLESRAKETHRSLSAQVLNDLLTMADASAGGARKGKFIGRFDGGRVPTDADVREVRARLWGRLAGLKHD